MKRMIIQPIGDPCPLEKCPPGFFIYHDHLGFITAYGKDPDAYIEDGGYFLRSKETLVQPAKAEWKKS